MTAQDKASPQYLRSAELSAASFPKRQSCTHRLANHVATILRRTSALHTQQNMSRVYSVARVYVDANDRRPREYWDYENLHEIQWGDMLAYEVVAKIGRGKYLEVFEGINVLNLQPCVVKVLKPVKLKKIHREIKILQNLTGGPNIVQLYDVVQDPALRIPAFVFERVNNVDFRTLYPTFVYADLQHYFRQLLTALDYCHLMGIIHRDVKPQNVMIDPSKRQLKLIDWGLAEFYHKGTNFNVRVALRFHKGPELLVNLQQYDYSLDLWSVGCMVAAIAFKREPFFKGDSNPDQLVKIAKILGTDGLHGYLRKYGLPLPAEYKLIMGTYPRKPWEAFVNDKNRDLSTNPRIVEFVDALVRYDHQERLTAREALDSDFFKE